MKTISKNYGLLLIFVFCLARAPSLIAGMRAAPRQARVNQHALYLDQFSQSVAKYVSLHKRLASQLPALKPTSSPEKILEYQRSLAGKIRAARAAAKRGDLFTPAIAREFRRLIRLSLHGRQAAAIRSSLLRGAPVRLSFSVNGVYPPSAPLETTPPSLLLNLPELPPELEYRIVGRALVLRDVQANIIVDYIRNAIP